MPKRFKRRSFYMVPVNQAETEIQWQPVADVYKTRTGWLLKFELAGVMREDVTVAISGNSLTVSGVRRDWITVEEICSLHSMEISYNRFERTIELPCELEQARLDSEFRNGILLVRVTTEGRGS
jgi:HSP20 family protein